MKYRVLPGQTVTWPDGTTRAKAGEVFEAYDTADSPVRRVVARGWMIGQWEKCRNVSQDVAASANHPMPPELYRQMHDAVEAEGLRYRTRSLDRRIARLGNPEE